MKKRVRAQFFVEEKDKSFVREGVLVRVIDPDSGPPFSVTTLVVARVTDIQDDQITVKDLLSDRTHHFSLGMVDTGYIFPCTQGEAKREFEGMEKIARFLLESAQRDLSYRQNELNKILLAKSKARGGAP